jgi:hypothetical protein
MRCKANGSWSCVFTCSPHKLSRGGGDVTLWWAAGQMARGAAHSRALFISYLFLLLFLLSLLLLCIYTSICAMCVAEHPHALLMSSQDTRMPAKNYTMRDQDGATKANGGRCHAQGGGGSRSGGKGGGAISIRPRPPVSCSHGRVCGQVLGSSIPATTGCVLQSR